MYAEIEQAKLLTEKAVADLLGVSRSLLRKWRRLRDRGPRWLRLEGKAIRYRTDDVLTWLNSQSGPSDSDRG